MELSVEVQPSGEPSDMAIHVFLQAVFDEGFHTLETTDAVIDVYDQVVFVQVGEGFDGLDIFNSADTASGLILAENLVMA